MRAATLLRANGTLRKARRIKRAWLTPDSCRLPGLPGSRADRLGVETVRNLLQRSYAATLLLNAAGDLYQYARRSTELYALSLSDFASVSRIG